MMGSFYLHAGFVAYDIALPAASCGLFAVAVLNVNNIRDIESDEKAGKRSIPVRLGRQKAVVYHWLILGSAVVFTILFVVLNYQSLLQWSFLVFLPLVYINARAVYVKKQAMDLDPYLKQMASTTMLFVIVFGVSHLLAF